MYKTSKTKLRNLNDNTFDMLSEMSFTVKNLYNSTLYTVRKKFFDTGEYLNYYGTYPLLKENENYSLLPAQVAQQTIQCVDRSFRSFFELLKKKKAGFYAKQINVPHYLHKESKFTIIFPYQCVRINYETNLVKLTAPKKLREKYNLTSIDLPFPKYLDKTKMVKEIRIKPVYNGLWFEMLVIYRETEKEQITKNDNFLSVDLGINNLMTCVSNKTNSFIADGRHLKSINRYFNKKINNLKSITKKVNDKNTSTKIRKLNQKRNDIFNYNFNLLSKRIIELCVKNNIGNIFIGYNTGWKDEINLGKHNNQNFVQMPYVQLISKIRDKGSEYGIEIQTINESYTSKCSALELEEIKKHDHYLGKRIHRGLFKTSKNKVINADVNGALNIAHKCKSKSIEKWIADSGAVVVPKRIRFQQLEQTSLERFLI